MTVPLWDQGPLNLNVNISKIVYSDVDPVLNIDENGDLELKYGVDAVKGSIENILKTMRGERPMLRGFGASLENLIFDLISEDTKDIAISTIQSEINNWDRRAVIEDIEVENNEDTNTVKIKIYCTVVDTGTEFVSEVSI